MMHSPEKFGHFLIVYPTNHHSSDVAVWFFVNSARWITHEVSYWFWTFFGGNTDRVPYGCLDTFRRILSTMSSGWISSPKFRDPILLYIFHKVLVGLKSKRWSHFYNTPPEDRDGTLLVELMGRTPLLYTCIFFKNTIYHLGITYQSL